MKTILERFGRLSAARSIRDDGLIDQLHHFATTSTFIALAALFTIKKVLAAPGLHCWTPAEYSVIDDAQNTRHYRDYVDSYCWVTGLYNIPFNEELPIRVEDRYTEDRSVFYYRWIVVIFLLQALMFKFPNIIWRGFVSFSGINLQKMVKMTLDVHLLSEVKRRETLTAICDCINRWLEGERRHRNTTLPLAAVVGKTSGCALSRLYLVIKVLFLVNNVVQFEFLSHILGFDYWLYGRDIFRKLATKHNFEDFNHFPRFALCDLEIRQLQNIHRYTVQCSLSFNVFVEKVFAAEWFVLAGLVGVTAASLALYIFEHVFNRQKRFIRKYAIMMKIPKGSRDKKLFKSFVRKYLKDDGVFVLRIISNNSSEVLAVELLDIMWKTFKDLRIRKAGSGVTTSNSGEEA